VHSIKCAIFNEAITNCEKYKTFLPDLTSKNYSLFVKNYLLHKQYNTSFGDIVPTIIANSFSINLIINDCSGNLNQIINILPDSPTISATVSIHKLNDHYSALVPIPSPNTSSNPTKENSQTKDTFVYNRSTLLSLRNSGTHINRNVRKQLFKYNLWQPKLTSPLNSLDASTSSPPQPTIPANPSVTSPLSYPTIARHPGIKRNKIKLSLINARSIRNKTAAILHHFHTTNIDICAITESWITHDDTITISELSTDTTDFKVVPRPHRSGGGTAILYRNNLKITPEEDGCLDSFEFSIWKIHNKAAPCVIVILYRPPYSTANPVTFSKFLSEFPTFVTTTLANYNNYIILGDFNVHFNQTESSATNQFCDILKCLGLDHHVQCPTHLNGNTLDNILTPINTKLTISNPTSEFFISDHCFVSCLIDLPLPSVSSERVSFRKLKQIDSTDFSIHLQAAADSLLSDDSGDIHQLSDNYYTLFKAVLDRHAPVITKTITRRKKVAWFDGEALRLKRKKRKLERQWRKSNLPSDKSDYLDACASYKFYLSSAKDRHLNQLITQSQGDSAKLFKIIKYATGDAKKTVLPDSTSDQELATKFSQFFLDKIINIRNSLDHHDNFRPDTLCKSRLDSFRTIHSSTIQRLVSTAKPASCHSDPLPTKFVKDYSAIFTPVLTKLVNISLSTATFPSTWKDAIITPIPKKQSIDNNNFQSYRPISNLSFVSKITEKSALSILTPYFEENSLLPNYQSAYRKHHSTETAAIKVVNDLLWNMESKKVSGLVAIDLSAAFDTVDHNTLLSVLNNCFGIDGDALKWCDSYLRPRRMHVNIRNTASPSLRLPFSVPQGSAAGPILFTAYASTLQHTIDNTGFQISGYADDHILYNSFSSSNIEAETSFYDNLRDCLKKIHQWMNLNRLKMNNDKTEFILCGHRSQLQKCSHDHLTIGDTSISVSKKIKYLGLTIDSELNFKAHINSKCRVASLNLRNIKALRKHLSTDSCKTLVQALVLSHLDYGSAVLAGLPASSLRPAQLVQNHAARVILGRDKFSSATSALRDLNWLPIRQRSIFKLLQLVHKCLYQNAPKYLIDMLVLQPTPTRATRSTVHSSMKLIIPHTHKATFAARSFSVMGPTYWNSLPQDLRTCASFLTFRRKLKTHLFNQHFNT
jgi:hypothetical protein